MAGMDYDMAHYTQVWRDSYVLFAGYRAYERSVSGKISAQRSTIFFVSPAPRPAPAPAPAPAPVVQLILIEALFNTVWSWNFGIVQYIMTTSPFFPKKFMYLFSVDVCNITNEDRMFVKYAN